MEKQLVQVGIINRALDLHPDTPIITTLAHLGQLVSFRKQHLPCNNIIFNLRDQLSTIKTQLLEQNAQHLRERIAIAKQQSDRLFKVPEKEGEKKDRSEKKYQRYENLQQFMKDEYEIQIKKKQKRGGKLKLQRNIDEWHLPTREENDEQQQAAGQREQEQVEVSASLIESGNV